MHNDNNAGIKAFALILVFATFFVCLCGWIGYSIGYLHNYYHEQVMKKEM